MKQKRNPKIGKIGEAGPPEVDDGGDESTSESREDNGGEKRVGCGPKYNYEMHNIDMSYIHDV